MKLRSCTWPILDRLAVLASGRCASRRERLDAVEIGNLLQDFQLDHTRPDDYPPYLADKLRNLVHVGWPDEQRACWEMNRSGARDLFRELHALDRMRRGEAAHSTRRRRAAPFSDSRVGGVPNRFVSASAADFAFMTSVATTYDITYGLRGIDAFVRRAREGDPAPEPLRYVARERYSTGGGWDVAATHTQPEVEPPGGEGQHSGCDRQCSTVAVPLQVPCTYAGEASYDERLG